MVGDRTVFKHTDTDLFKKVLTAYIRPNLESASAVWPPCLRTHTSAKAGQKATHKKTVPEVRESNYTGTTQAIHSPVKRHYTEDIRKTLKFLNRSVNVGNEQYFETGRNRSS